MKKRQSLKQILLTLYDACFCVKHLDNNKIQVSNIEIKNGSICPEGDDSVSEENANVGTKRIKVVITRKQLDRLLAKQVSLEQLILLNQRMFFKSLDDNKWKPQLESIHEKPDL